MLAGFEHLPRAGVGNFTGGGHKLCLHTTEGSSVVGAIAALDKHKSWSHFLLSFEEKRKIQFIEVNQAAKSLSNNTGDGYQTNKANVVQVEICGFAKEAGGWSTAKLDWLAGCFSEIRKAFDFPLVHLDFKVPAVRLSDKAFVDYAGVVGHQHAPDNCVSPNTKILTSQLEWVEARDLCVGDELIGFEENTVKGDRIGRRFISSTVEVAMPTTKESCLVTTDKGSIQCTTDHPFFCQLLTVKHGSRYGWVKAKDLDSSLHSIVYFGDTWSFDSSRQAGWLSGLMDTDGSVSTASRITRSGSRDCSIQFGQKPGAVADSFAFENSIRKFDWRMSQRHRKDGYSTDGYNFVDFVLRGGIYEQLRFLGSIRPLRLMSNEKSRGFWEGRPVGTCLRRSIAIIQKVEYLGVQDIIGLQTSSKTYIADGYLCHNSHWDPGALNVSYIVSKMKGGNVSTDALTKEEIIVIYGFALNEKPNDGTYNAYLGKPLSGFLTAVARLKTLQKQVGTKELISPSECPSVPSVPGECKCDVDAIAEAVVKRTKEQYEK